MILKSTIGRESPRPTQPRSIPSFPQRQLLCLLRKRSKYFRGRFEVWNAKTTHLRWQGFRLKMVWLSLWPKRRWVVTRDIGGPKMSLKLLSRSMMTVACNKSSGWKFWLIKSRSRNKISHHGHQEREYSLGGPKPSKRQTILGESWEKPRHLSAASSVAQRQNLIYYQVQSRDQKESEAVFLRSKQSKKSVDS